MYEALRFDANIQKYTVFMVSASYPYTTHSYDVLIIGAGGAGLRAAIAAAEGGAKVAIVSKVPPMRTHTAAAQGGINAALGNVTPDDWRWHMYDTVRGSDWLSDQDAVAFMCKEAPGAIRDLEKMGVHFSRDEQGNIYQRAYGGMSTHFGKGGMAYRACAAADHIGNAMMQGLSGHVHRYDVDIHVEFVVLDLLVTAKGHSAGCWRWSWQAGSYMCSWRITPSLPRGGMGRSMQPAPRLLVPRGMAMPSRCGRGWHFRIWNMCSSTPRGCMGMGC